MLGFLVVVCAEHTEAVIRTSTLESTQTRQVRMMRQPFLSSLHNRCVDGRQIQPVNLGTIGHMQTAADTAKEEARPNGLKGGE